MKLPHPKPEVRVRVGAVMSNTMPSYTLEQAEAEYEKLRAEREKIDAGTIDVAAIYRRWNRKRA